MRLHHIIYKINMVLIMIKVFLVLAIILALVFIFKKSAFGSEDKLLGKLLLNLSLKILMEN